MKKQLLLILFLYPFFQLFAQQPTGIQTQTIRTPQQVVMSAQGGTTQTSHVVFFDDGGVLGNVGSSPLISTFIGNGQTLELFFTEFDLPVGAFLYVYQGASVEGELLGSFQGGQNQKPWNYKGHSFTIQYYPAPNTAPASGWRGEIHELSADYFWAKATMPESDCINALPICSNSTVNTSANQYDNTGSVNDDTGGCYSGTGSGGSVWYQFSPMATGPLDFGIAPSGSTDYDFVLWDITNGCDSRTEMSCNFSATFGTTGISTSGAATNSQDASGSTFNQRVNVTVGRRYAICINYYSGNNDGFVLNFQNNAGSVAVTDNVPPIMTNATVNSCVSASTVDVFFSEYMDCNTLQSSDFTIPGRTVTLTVTNCTGTPSRTQRVTLSVSPALAGPGTYTLTANNCTDLCGNPLNANYNIILGAIPVANAGPDRVVCRGVGLFGTSTYTTVTLNASGGTNYYWSTGQTSASISVSPSTPTIYTVSVQNGSACVSTDQVATTIETTPAPNLGATQTVCTGFPVSLLSGVTPGGVTYQWQSTTSTNFFGQPTGFANIAGQTGPNLTITPASASTWYRVIITSAGGCQGTSTVRVNQGTGAFAITPNSAFACAGQSVMLSLPASLTAYTWSTGTNANQALTVTPATTTTYSVTSTTAGCTGTSSITIPVRPVQTVSAVAAPAIVCVGDATTLTGGPASANNTVSENFEGGTQVFTLVNGARNNWHHGTAAFATGTRGLYIGTSSANNNYEIGTAFGSRAATNFAYRDIPVTSFCNATASFAWRCNGVSGSAELTVWVIPTSVVPSATAGNSLVAGAGNVLMGGPYFGQASYQNVTLDLTPFAGQTVRLVFQWRNVGQNLFGTVPAPANPAASIDNFVFTESTTYTYNWTASVGGFSSSAQNTNIFPSANTTYTLQATRCDGCTAQASTAVTICTVLGLELSRFKADCGETKAKVQWAAENEAGIDSYILQYSHDAVNFDDVAQLYAGLGTYESLVSLSNTTNSHYFRLKQINIDGAISYSNIIQTSCSGFMGQVDIFPNPTSGNLNVRFGTEIFGNYKISVIDLLGRTLSTQTYQLTADNNEIQINISLLAPTVYYLKIEDKEDNMTPRILKFVKK